MILLVAALSCPFPAPHLQHSWGFSTQTLLSSSCPGFLLVLARICPAGCCRKRVELEEGWS